MFSQQIRCFHRSLVRLARGVRRTDAPKPLPPLTHEEIADDVSVQEQFARLEQENEIEDDPPERTSIDPSTTSIILFPEQGTQFVGMGYVEFAREK